VVLKWSSAPRNHAKRQRLRNPFKIAHSEPRCNRRLAPSVLRRAPRTNSWVAPAASIAALRTLKQAHRRCPCNRVPPRSTGLVVCPSSASSRRVCAGPCHGSSLSGVWNFCGASDVEGRSLQARSPSGWRIGQQISSDSRARTNICAPARIAAKVCGRIRNPRPPIFIEYRAAARQHRAPRFGHNCIASPNSSGAPRPARCRSRQAIGPSRCIRTKHRLRARDIAFDQARYARTLWRLVGIDPHGSTRPPYSDVTKCFLRHLHQVIMATTIANQVADSCDLKRVLLVQKRDQIRPGAHGPVFVS